jgi:arachidonate 15-lipoxygenase (second type) / 8-lipoxygenase (S-type)
MFEVFSIQVLADTLLFEPGRAVDIVFPFTGRAARDYTTKLYNDGAGRFQSNYFRANLQNRGLPNATTGPELKHFPFYEDASVIFGAIHDFMTTLVNSYYSSDADVAADSEIQMWVSEANGPAGVWDFPSEIRTRSTLVDVLTQMVRS